MPKPKKTKAAQKAAKKRKAEKAKARMITRSVNVPAALDAPETRWVVPLIATDNETQKRHAVGTAFFIAPDILLTAWHNIPSLISNIVDNPDIERDSFKWPESEVLDFMTISVLQIIEGGYGLRREVRQVHRSRFSNDIAILRVWRDETVPSNTPIEFASLDADPPLIGERIRAFGYAASIAHDGLTADGLLLLGHDPRLASGNVKEINEQGFGSVRPFPYFDVEADFMPGMSGGPVNNLQGRVCGVVSRGMGGVPPRSYAACIWPILGEQIQWEDFNGGEPFRIMDLVRQNAPGQDHPYIRMASFQNYQVGMNEATQLPMEVRRRLD
ncbi:MULTISPECIES: S1 family peptidase [Deinococcus]|uniref:Serine protease n=1 Tax=Deinococcus rufus TaxID=2136097 RepID=A0ABV7ZCL3_9DEIO|nr:serine protease [Deinococcus sp. AB2017081]WQE94979.1 serine protease [Deinococcus sp. AB2017081]